MHIENISPFVRFTARQLFTHGQKNMIAYDNRIYFCLKNNGHIVINGVSYKLIPNSFILWRPGMTYSYYSDDPTAPIEVATCNFDFTKTAQYLSTPIPPSNDYSFNKNKIIQEDTFIENNGKMNDVVYIPNASILRTSFIALCSEYKNKFCYYQAKMNTILQDILLTAARLTENELLANSTELINEILSFLQANYINNPTYDEIGKKFGYHPNHINSLMVKHLGVSLHKYILSCKLNAALEYLMNSNFTIQEIAEKVNIPDPQYFSRLFKKYYKTSPSFFRKGNNL